MKLHQATIDQARRIVSERMGITLPGATVAAIPKEVRVASSGTGSRLAKKFADRIAAVPCGSCKRIMAEMDMLTVDQVRERRDEFVERIEANAPNSGAAWWAKAMMMADSCTTGGIAMRVMIGMWLDEAIAEESTESIVTAQRLQ